MTHAANDEDPVDRDEQAAEWCWRIADGALCEDDQRVFDAWLHADPGNRQAFDEMIAVWQGTDAIAEMPGFLSLRAKALTTMEQARDEPPSRHWLKWRAGLAAAAAMLIMVLGSVWLLTSGPQTYETGIGERRMVRLDDGSRVSLDASSAVTVAYSRDRRALMLERGRAKFDVAKDPLRPFSVTAGEKTIVATGTAFSVELLHNQVRVVLYEGHVEVLAPPAPGKRPAPVRIARSNVAADHVLAPGTELVTKFTSAVAVVAPADVERSLSWEAGRLSFSDEPLSSAVERVNRYSDVPIVIGDAAAGKHLINGVFDAGDTRSFVSGVASLYPIRVRREGGQIVLASSSENAP